MNGVEDLLADSLIARTDALDVVFESSADCVQLITVDGRVARINQTGLSELEFDDPARVLGAPWAALWPDAERSSVQAAVRQSASGETARFQAYGPTAQGKPKWWEVKVSPIRDQGGSVVALLAISRDVSEHAALRQALITVAEGGVITGWSPGAQAMYGWSAEEAVGRTFDLIVPERLREGAMDWCEGFFKTGDLDRMGRCIPSTGLRRIGEEFPVECVMSALPADDGWTLLVSIQAMVGSKERIELFENAFQSAPIGMALVSLDGRFLKLNKAFCALVGYDDGALLTKDFQSITHPDDLDADLAYLEQLLAGEISEYQLEKRYIRADGTQAWANLSVTLVRFADGRPKFFIAQVQDLTARREAEGRYRLLAENVSDVVSLHDEQGCCLYVSPSAERVFGYPPEEVLGRTPFDFLPERTLARLRQGGEHTFRSPSEETVTHLLHALHKDGRPIWVEVACRGADDETGRRVTVAVARDVSGRLESERRYRLLADKTADILVLAELNGHVTFVAGACERILGWPPEQLTGSKSRARVHPDDKERVRDLLKRIGKGEGGLHLRYRGLCKDGSWRWLESNPSLVFEEDGGVLGFVDAVRDVTDQVAQENELAQAREEAEAAAQAKARFLANMSHEIRTPLTSVIGFSDLLLGRDDLQPDIRHYANRISSASRALLTVVNDVLDFSKIEAGQFEIRPAPVDAVEVVREAVAIFASAAEAKGVGLRLETDAPERSSVEIDAPRVRQVLLNLVGNAMKFTEQGEVVVRMQCADDRMFVAVTDTGPGIEPEDQRKLFQRFSQVDASPSRRHGGTGLGLAICKGLVEAMGGSIKLSSRPGHGSTFEFDISAPALAQASTARAEPAGETHIDRVRVLVADDNPVNRELVRAILEGFGAEVAEASDGQEALLMAAAALYDVILMDLRMPRLDGYGALRQLRAAPGMNQHTPVLAFTADVVEAELDAFDGAIAKPIEPRRLADAIEACLTRPAAPDEAVSSRAS